MNRVGTGYDLHRLVENKPLVLGGVEIEHYLGLEGHSDADVLLHALGDALLGAACLGDLGFHFPPGEDRYRDISSLVLLEEIKNKLLREGWKPANVDGVIIAQAPPLAPYIETMREKIASALDISRCQVSVKATTTEQLGVCGREEGIAAQAVVLLEKPAP
ncbi:MAG: 2-C-methyl-D-erythritol 2,4-cyclodiphosphate synthase [Bacillota bacterium]